MTEPWPFLATRKRESLVVALIALAALTLRVVHVLDTRGGPGFDAPQMDMGYHLEWARAIAAGDTFQPGEPFFRAPLYPWVLGFFLKLSGGGLLLPRLLQAAFGAATVVLTYLLGRRSFGPNVGCVASAVAALSWVLIYFDGELLIPTLLVPLVLLALWASLGLRERPRPASAFGAGLAWGLAVIARPNALLFLPLLALWLLLAMREGAPPRWRAAGALVLGVLGPILPLTAYNTFVAHDPALISTQAGVNLWIGNNPDSNGWTAIVPGTRGGWWEGFDDSIVLAEAAEGRELRPSHVSRHYTGRTLAWVTDEPLAAGRLLLHKVHLLISGTEVGNNQSPRFTATRFSPWLAASPVRWPLLFGLGLVGIVLAWRREAVALLPLWGFVAIYAGSIVLFFVNARFRVPLVPVLAVFAAHAALWIVAELRERRVARAVGAATAAGLLVSLSTVPSVAPEVGASNGRVTLAVGYVKRGAPGDLGRADELLEEALTLTPKSLPAWRALARVRELRGDVDAAVRTYEVALQCRPGDEDSVDGLLGTLVRAARYEEAFVRARALRASFPKLSGPVYFLGAAHLRQGHAGPAQRRFEETIELGPKRFRGYFGLAWIEFRKSGPAAALRNLEHSVELIADASPEQRVQAWDLLIEVYEALGRPEDAQRVLQDALRAVPDFEQQRALAERN